MGRWPSGVFLFQAEDGIRGLVRSRGLGDVYKRQEPKDVLSFRDPKEIGLPTPTINSSFIFAREDVYPVSYTHLTLPTSDLV